MKKLFGFLLVGVALFAAFGDVENINWPDGKPDSYVVAQAAEPSPVDKEAVLKLEADFKAGGGKSLVGLFDAIARETRDNKRVKTLASVERFNYAAMERYVLMSGFKPVPGLGDKVDRFVFEGIENLDDPRAPLTDKLRRQLSDRYLALEWLVQNL